MPKKDQSFEVVIFTFLILENYILDFGRPIVNNLIESPLHLPGVGDYFHMAYNVITAFLLLKLLKSSHRMNDNIAFFLVCVFVLGASMHLVGDSVETRRFYFENYDLKTPVFQLLYFYDEYLGHYLWYLAYFTTFLVYFNSNFTADLSLKLSKGNITLGLFGGFYFFYTIVEGRVWPLFLTMYGLMLVQVLRRRSQLKPNINGRFILLMFGTTLVIFCVWIIIFRDIPQFWDVYRMIFGVTKRSY